MDDEIKGEGNSINYKYRMHDPRIGRFFAVDPLTSKYPHYSPYSFSGNKVIHRVELEGLEDGQISTHSGDAGIRLLNDDRIDHLSKEEYIEHHELKAVVAKPIIRYLTPLEEMFTLVYGSDFDGNESSAAEAGVWIIASYIPGAKFLKPVFGVAKKGSKISAKISNFANKTLLDEHFVKHAKEFGDKFKTAEQYAKGAQNFFKRTGDNIMEYTRKNGDVVRYDKKNNVFGVAKKDGTIKTMFKPEDSLDYFKKELNTDLGEDALKALEKS
jgi:hypothetical protein